MEHLERSWLREAGKWLLVIVGIMGIAAFILFLIFGVVVGLSYLVEALYR